jgi:hypothetical protein
MRGAVGGPPIIRKVSHAGVLVVVTTFSSHPFIRLAQRLASLLGILP